MNEFYIKTPQLIGIIAGCSVFVITISVVFYLLYLSGSFSKLMEELQSVNGDQKVNKKSADVFPQYSKIPLLYDYLLQARLNLGILPKCSDIKTNNVFLRDYNYSTDFSYLLKSCDGSALYHESGYDPVRIWGWLNTDPNVDLKDATENVFSIQNLFLKAFESNILSSRHLTIMDIELNKPIGMLSLVDNFAKNLSIRIGKK
jgi:hypothetical protein